MAEGDDKNKPGSTGNAADKELTLSAALLAPLNSIFEAQIHAARSFLSFILQMGFKHQYSEDEINALEKRKSSLGPVERDQLEESKKILNLRKTVKRLQDRSKVAELSERENLELRNSIAELQELQGRDNQIYLQEFNYADGSGNQQKIQIPNLALLPVKPLSVNSAKFNFAMKVKNVGNYSQIPESSGANRKRPWMLIDPQRISGTLAQPSGSKSSESAIQIEVTVGETEIPEGLSNLLVSLTQSARVVPNSESAPPPAPSPGTDNNNNDSNQDQ